MVFKSTVLVVGVLGKAGRFFKVSKWPSRMDTVSTTLLLVRSMVYGVLFNPTPVWWYHLQTQWHHFGVFMFRPHQFINKLGGWMLDGEWSSICTLSNTHM